MRAIRALEGGFVPHVKGAKVPTKVVALAPQLSVRARMCARYPRERKGKAQRGCARGGFREVSLAFSEDRENFSEARGASQKPRKARPFSFPPRARRRRATQGSNALN